MNGMLEKLVAWERILPMICRHACDVWTWLSFLSQWIRMHNFCAWRNSFKMFNFSHFLVFTCLQNNKSRFFVTLTQFFRVVCIQGSKESLKSASWCDICLWNRKSTCYWSGKEQLIWQKMISLGPFKIKRTGPVLTPFFALSFLSVHSLQLGSCCKPHDCLSECLVIHNFQAFTSEQAWGP